MKQTEGVKGVVLKVASRCNLNCTYCYMYNLGDESYRNQPKRMSDEVVKALVERVTAHCEAFALSEFECIFHGGEPLLAGPEFFKRFVQQMRQHPLLATRRLRFGLQTNGTLLDSDWCRLLKELDIGLGISLDGPSHWHDLHRRDHHGRGSHAEALRGLRIAQAEDCQVGLLSVLNVATDPLEWYSYFKSLRVQSIDFLWPDHHYENLPSVYQQRERSPGYTPFGDWWIALFDQWFYERSPKPTIRFLNQLLLLLMGIDNGFESIGQGENRYLIIETDGSIEASDYMKACGDGFTKEGLNVLTHPLTEAYHAPIIGWHRNSHRRLAAVCQTCVVKEVCGGGHVAHRFSRALGFRNRSVYCYDLLKLITHVQNALLSRLSPSTIKKANIAPVTYEEALQFVQLST